MKGHENPVSVDEVRIHLEYVLSDRNTDQLISLLHKEVEIITACDRWRKEKKIDNLAYDTKRYRRMDM